MEAAGRGVSLAWALFLIAFVGGPRPRPPTPRSWIFMCAGAHGYWGAAVPMVGEGLGVLCPPHQG